MPALRFTHAAILLAAPGLLLAVVGLPGCANLGKADIAPEAQACAQSVAPARAGNFSERLAALTLRANTVAECMTSHGFVLDEAKLQEKLLHEEWVRNSNVMGSDPQNYLMLLEQELRASPALWKRGTPPRSS